MAATTALELEAEQKLLHCPKTNSRIDKNYDGQSNDKINFVSRDDFTIAFTLGRIVS